MVAFGIGLWLILSLGGMLLKAPEDLAGTWALHDPDEAADDETPAKTMVIEQSGRYFRLLLDDRNIAMRLADQATRTDHGLLQTVITLRGESGQATFVGVPGSDRFELELTGRQSGRWTATCVERLYPRPKRPRRSAARSPTAPATHPATVPATSNARL